MKTYCQYLIESPISGKLIEACGSDALIRLDGRESLESHKSVALRESKKRMKSYDGFVIIRGSSLLNAKPICDPYRI